MEASDARPIVFVVDDDAGLVRLIERWLRREGYEVQTAGTGKDAVDWLRKHSPDLMLLDLKLQDMDGNELISHLELIGRQVPFIIITGQGDERVAVDMMKRGALDYLVKDVQFIEFVPTVVKRALSRLEKERKLAAAEQALRVSEERFRLVLRNSPIIVFSQDRDLRYTWIHNPTGLPSDDVVGKTDFDIVPAADAQKLTEIKRRVLETGVGTREEVTIEVEGIERTYDLNLEPLRAVDGTIEGITCATVDITRRRRAQLRHRVQNAATSALSEAGSIPEAGARILKAICETLGWSIGELWSVDHNQQLLHHLESWPAGKSELMQFEAIARQTSFTKGVGLPGRAWSAGKPVWVSDVAKDQRFCRTEIAAREGIHAGFAFPIFVENEILAVLAFFSNRVREPDEELLHLLGIIGSQVGQFIERKRAEEALRKEHEFISAVLDTSGALVVVLDRSARIVRFNRACEQTTGYIAAEVIGKVLWDFLIVPEEKESVRDVFNDLRAGQFPNQHENFWRARDGNLRLIAWSNSALVDAAGKVEYVVSTGIDVTERKRLEQEVLEISDREQRRIGQDLHDGLCQHLAGIELMAQVLEQSLTSKSRPLAERAGDVARHVREAIKQTRLLARGMSPVAVESEGLMSGLAELAANTEVLFHVKCRFECPGPVLVHDEAIATHLFRIAQEAVSNAIKHGKATDIVIRLEHLSNRTVLTISDNGVGLAKTDPNPHGMGMRIMQYRASVISGTLTVHSSPGEGTLVTCVIQNTDPPRHEHE